MEKFIEKAFKRILHTDVKVLYNQYEGYSDGSGNAYSIYVIHNDIKDKSDEELVKFSPEYEIFEMHKSKEWVYCALMQTYGGSYWQPPEWDMVESKETHQNVDNALLALIYGIIQDKFADLQMCREEAKHNEEYLKERND